MNFNTTSFLLVFLPIVLIIFHLIPTALIIDLCGPNGHDRLVDR